MVNICYDTLQVEVSRHVLRCYAYVSWKKNTVLSKVRRTDDRDSDVRTGIKSGKGENRQIAVRLVGRKRGKCSQGGTPGPRDGPEVEKRLHAGKIGRAEAKTAPASKSSRVTSLKCESRGGRSTSMGTTR